ncbi:Hypothetical predicted protein [Prunus dulcis]|uniref:Uncharacterized protein n=1 Tax=Prunus dulcis TaxID=3755 RepID=A0A5E4GQK7_PRUDU|nr:Hypothetical predicted protein [Prunus dulcis]
MESSTKRETRENTNSFVSIVLALAAPNATTLPQTKNGTKRTPSFTKAQSNCSRRAKLLSRPNPNRKRKQEATPPQQHEGEREHEDKHKQELDDEHEHEHERKKKR